jgi:hypothetical protein
MTTMPKSPLSQAEEEQLVEWFTYHSVNQDQTDRQKEVRDAAHAFAMTITRCVPPGADRNDVVRMIRKVMFTANSAIAVDQIASQIEK